MPIAHRDRLRAGRRLHRAAEACGRSRRAWGRGRRSPARRSTSSRRGQSISMVPANAEIVIEGTDRSEHARARGAVRRKQRLCRARGIQHADAGDGDHAQAIAGVRLHHQPGHAERIQRHQEGRLRAGVPRASARRLSASRGSSASSCTSALTNLRPVIFLQFACRNAAQRSVARTYGRGGLYSRQRQDRDRGERRHRSGEYRRGVLVDCLSLEPDRGRAHHALSRLACRVRSTARKRRRIRCS